MTIPTWSNLAFALWVILLIGGTFKVHASVCDVALQSNALNTSDYAKTSSILLSKHDDVCRAEYNSQKEAVNAARSSGASIGYGAYSFGASDAKQIATGTWSISDSSFCKATAEELDSFTSIRVKQQVADIALAAWSECINNVESNKLFATYSANKDGSGITGTLYRSVSRGGVGVITGIIVTGTSDSTPGKNKEIVHCMIGTTPVSPNTALVINIDRTNIAFQCSKKSKNDVVKVAISTSQGDTPWMQLPSDMEMRNTDIEEANTAIEGLRGRFSKLEEKVIDLDSKLNKLTQLVTSHSSDIANTNQKISTLNKDLSGKANKGDFSLKVEGLDSCIAVLDHSISGTGKWWPLVMAPCGGGYQKWRTE